MDQDIFMHLVSTSTLALQKQSDLHDLLLFNLNKFSLNHNQLSFYDYLLTILIHQQETLQARISALPCQSTAVISCKALSEVKSSLRTHRWRFDTFPLPGHIPYMASNKTINQKFEHNFSIKVFHKQKLGNPVMFLIQAMKSSETKKKESIFAKSALAPLLALVLNLCCLFSQHYLNQIYKAFMPTEVFPCVSLCNVFCY